jgi:N-acetylmuramoyl-L-alanine amidase
VKHADFYLLRKNSIRAALTECGFLTNNGDARLAVQASYRQTLAEGISEAVRQCRR